LPITLFEKSEIVFGGIDASFSLREGGLKRIYAIRKRSLSGMKMDQRATKISNIQQ
jgi:hypothetical protein